MKNFTTINSLKKWTIYNMERIDDRWLWRHEWAFMTEWMIALRQNIYFIFILLILSLFFIVLIDLIIKKKQ